MKTETCAYIHCEKEADFIDAMGDFVCEECMEREVQHGGDSYDDFQSIGDL